MTDLCFTLNGRPIEAREVDPRESLLHWLRDHGLTGTKEGCAEGECGACAVALVTRNAAGQTQYSPVNSCLLLMGAMAGQEVVTVEGIAPPDGLHPVQEDMVRRGGSQCGYCTPGFVVSLFSEYYRPDRTTYDPEAISGNLCRCTGYRPIRDVAQHLGRPDAADPHLVRLGRPAPTLQAAQVTRGQARVERPVSLQQALVLAQEPGAKIIAGGTDLAVERNQRHVRWPLLIAIDAVEELRRVTWSDNALVIGAGVPLSEVEGHIHGRIPLLEQLFPLFSSRLIRNRATLGGNLANASPIGDGAPAFLALDADVLLADAESERSVSLAEFFVDYRETVLKAGELITAVKIPLPLPSLSRFYKVSKRILDDISTVAAAFSLRMEGSTIKAARFAYGGVAATPLRAQAAEAAVVGLPWNADTHRKARRALQGAFSPMGDHRGTQAYREAMIGSLMDKFFAETGEGP
ncbi:MAG: FAD binding domain-containing protein [Myxococcales bacterium]|nr:FAD binding domain-containing protein [Myxococcales bacterium]